MQTRTNWCTDFSWIEWPRSGKDRGNDQDVRYKSSRLAFGTFFFHEFLTRPHSFYTMCVNLVTWWIFWKRPWGHPWHRKVFATWSQTWRFSQEILIYSSTIHGTMDFSVPVFHVRTRYWNVCFSITWVAVWNHGVRRLWEFGKGLTQLVSTWRCSQDM